MADREPMPSDGPEYAEDHRAWEARQHIDEVPDRVSYTYCYDGARDLYVVQRTTVTEMATFSDHQGAQRALDILRSGG